VRQALRSQSATFPSSIRLPEFGFRGLDGEFILFPSIEQIKESDLDLVVAGHKNAISMVEAGATEVSEEDMVEALKFAHEAIKMIVAEFEKFAKEVGTPKREVKL